MKRRSFIRSAAALSLGVPFGARLMVEAGAKSVPAAASPRGSFAVDGNQVRFFSAEVAKALKVLVVADTHLFTDDERGEPFRQYSKRMASAYNQTRHFQTGKPTNPQESFAQVLQHARESRVDLIALTGDIFSFPSEAAIEWIRGRLADAALPYIYVAGNHDWHYEGMEGSLENLRATWIEKRLRPLYQGNHPLMAAYDVNGIRFLAIDNSIYEILPEQLEFFRTHANSGQPLVLLVHIPLYAPGRNAGFGCGHPDWGAETDRNHEVERRPQWPRSGHSRVTLDFHREVFAATNLLAIFAGHIHRQSLDVVHGIGQFVTEANATGAFMHP
jgi:predicted phosphodiesterase